MMDYGLLMREYNRQGICSVGLVSRLDKIIRAEPEQGRITIREIFNAFENCSELKFLVVGLWSFPFLKDPKFYEGALVGHQGYQFNEDEKSAIVSGLIEVIKNCKIEIFEDVDAIDFHYSACGKLYRLVGPEAEVLLAKEMLRCPSYSLIESFGVLVGTEFQGKLLSSSVNLLKRIAEANNDGLGASAKKVLLEDVNRVNSISAFLSKPVLF